MVQVSAAKATPNMPVMASWVALTAVPRLMAHSAGAAKGIQPPAPASEPTWAVMTRAIAPLIAARRSV